MFNPNLLDHPSDVTRGSIAPPLGDGDGTNILQGSPRYCPPAPSSKKRGHQTIQGLYDSGNDSDDSKNGMMDPDLDLDLMFARPWGPKLEPAFDPLRFLDRVG